MKVFIWSAILASLAGIVYLCWRTYRGWHERRRSEDDRFAAFMGVARRPEPMPSLEAPAPVTAAQERLLFDAASKAAEAGEPALSVQLYERLLERYPASAFAGSARAAMQGQNGKLVKT